METGLNIEKIRNWLSGWRQPEHVCRDLLPSERVLQHLDLSKRRDLGLQEVSLDQIVGSSGRFRAFDLDFEPRRESDDARWQRIAQARQANISLPPIMLLKVGNAYLVEDGNHRISVARKRGETTIPARVMELDPTPLKKKETCSRLGYKV